MSPQVVPDLDGARCPAAWCSRKLAPGETWCEHHRHRLEAEQPALFEAMAQARKVICAESSSQQEATAALAAHGFALEAALDHFKHPS